MKGGLFWRTYSVIVAALLITIIIFSGVLAAARQQGLQDSYESEVRLQAREVANFMANLSTLGYVQRNATMKPIILNKITEIYRKYNADIWIVSYDSGIVQYLDSSWNTSESIASDAVKEQLSIIQAGDEIRVTGLFPELGDQIVTIGVPWLYDDRYVVGAVLLHIPTKSLKIGLSSVVRQILPYAVLSLLVGAVLAFFLAQSQIRPLKEINSAVREFTKGDLTRRVNLSCGGELEELGNSINRMAAELNRMEDSRRSFVANVSHELRSPMTSMRGYVQAMLDGTISQEDMPKYLGIVMDETTRLTDLVRDLLDLSRLESGKFPLTLAPFDLNELVRRTLINFEGRIDQKGIGVEADLMEGHAWVMGDANRISQVVTNIVDNAVKFMPDDGTGLLKVTTEARDGSVRVSISNNGPCIGEADLPYIFERFYKADKAHTSGQGTGLGLSICQRIMQQHGSAITVTSVPGDTCFAFALPAAEPPQPPAVGGQPANV